jgi:hypothetical protein
MVLFGQQWLTGYIRRLNMRIAWNVLHTSSSMWLSTEQLKEVDELDMQQGRLGRIPALLFEL